MLGDRDGDALGLADGLALGLVLGLMDGLALGEALGLDDGLVLGERDGAALGDVVGLAEGPVLGFADGSALGDAEGLALGDSVISHAVDVHRKFLPQLSPEFFPAPPLISSVVHRRFPAARQISHARANGRPAAQQFGVPVVPGGGSASHSLVGVHPTLPAHPRAPTSQHRTPVALFSFCSNVFVSVVRRHSAFSGLLPCCTMYDTCVGNRVGLAVGEALGDADGAALGRSLGAMEGPAVGIDVGLALGLEVGLGVGFGVGLDVGLDVGLRVGLALGSAVGARHALGWRPNTSISDTPTCTEPPGPRLAAPFFCTHPSMSSMRTKRTAPHGSWPLPILISKSAFSESTFRQCA